ncbi:unnamed protein product [Lepidochelys kempii]
MRETLAHIYIGCVRLQPLSQLLQNLVLSKRCWLHFSLQRLIDAYPIHGPTKLQDIISLLLVLARMAIHHSKKRKPDGGGMLCNCGAYFQSLAPSRVPLGGVH